MPREVNWLEKLTTSENKSRGSNSGKNLRLSSIDGWTGDSLPKLVIVWTFEKESSDAFPSISRPGRFSKKRDLYAKVESYELFLIDSEEYIVPWDEVPSHSDLIKMSWTPEWIAELKEKAGRLNKKYADRPINFQLSFKNGSYLRLQYQITDYRRLPACPYEVAELLHPQLFHLIGTEFKLWKDHSTSSGPVGWFTNEMAKWENERNLKESGTLFVRISGQDWKAVEDFTEGRQDYWSGFAIDHLMAQELPGFKDQGGHVTGSDHPLDLHHL